MACNSKPERYVLTLNNGLIQAHIVDNCHGEIKLDGNKPQDETCQFYFHNRFDTSHEPQCVHRFESVNYRGYNLYWDKDNNKVTLRKDNSDLASCKNIWWTVPDCEASKTDCPDLTSGLQLLKPFGYPECGDTFPFVLVFDADAHLTDQLTSVVENGQFKLDKIHT